MPQLQIYHPALPCSFLQLLLQSMVPHGVEHPFGLLGLAVLTVSLPSFLCTLSLNIGGMVRGAKVALVLCKCCSAITKTLVCCQHHFQHKSKKKSSMQTTVKKFDSNPVKSVQAQITMPVCEECFNICFVGTKMVPMQGRLEGNRLHDQMHILICCHT